MACYWWFPLAMHKDIALYCIAMASLFTQGRANLWCILLVDTQFEKNNNKKPICISQVTLTLNAHANETRKTCHPPARNTCWSPISSRTHRWKTFSMRYQRGNAPEICFDYKGHQQHQSGVNSMWLVKGRTLVCCNWLLRGRTVSPYSLCKGHCRHFVMILSCSLRN